MSILEKLKHYRRYFYIDTYLFILLMCLCVFSLFMLYSASGGVVNLASKQFLHWMLAIPVILIVAQISPNQLKRIAPILMLLGLILLVLVLFFGVSSKGATRWLDFGFMHIQPSEIMKIIVPIFVASVLSEDALPPKFKPVLISTGAILITFFLVYKQPDLGTSVLIASSGLFILFFSGFSWSPFKKTWLNILSFFTLTLAVSLTAWFYVLHNYQKQRIITFLDPERDALSSGYHIIQSKIAIGSGGLFGKGWTKGSQSQLNFLPEHQTDFIFALIAEELGLIGILCLLVLYGLIIYHCFVISLNASDNFSRLLAASLTTIFFTYIFVNIGMVSGLLPIVGIPLPLISYGGSSLVTLMIGFGILMSINANLRHFKKANNYSLSEK